MKMIVGLVMMGIALYAAGGWSFYFVGKTHGYMDCTDRRLQ